MRFTTIVFSLLFALPLSTIAQPKTLQLDEVTVTANKVEQKAIADRKGRYSTVRLRAATLRHADGQ